VSRHVGARHGAEDGDSSFRSDWPALTGNALEKALPTRAVMERYQVSDRSIDRWVADPNLGFPQPLKINRKRFFYEHELDAFDATRR
jgi:predicted DNA-binding transcriptional regulator AlpA